MGISSSYLIYYLDVIFRRISPEYVYNGLKDVQTQKLSQFTNVRKLNKDVFCRYARIAFPHFITADEIMEVYAGVLQELKELGEKSSVFKLLGQDSHEMLEFDKGQYPIYKTNRIWDFRELSLILGQDTLICSALADIGSKKTDYCWSFQIHGSKEDFFFEKQMNSEDFQVAENHFHLMGSLPVFDLSWISIMNHPYETFESGKVIDNFEKEFADNREMDILLNEFDYHLSWRKRLQLAAWIRARLFERIVDGRKNDILGEFLEFDDLTGSAIDELSRYVNRLRREYGIELKNKHKKSFISDYALSAQIGLSKSVESSNSRIFVGERAFLTKCFSMCDSEFNVDEENLFYLYLLIKHHFRGELIQLNKAKGFDNFQLYQRRKAVLWINNKHYLEEALNVGICETIDNSKLSSLEARIMPEKSIHQLRRTIEIPLSTSAEKYEKQFYYVIHFPKRYDELLESVSVNTDLATVHNSKIRQSTRKRAITLARALSVDKFLRKRIKGIDACSKEKYCRPEVFATEFRFLKKFYSNAVNEKSKLIRLSRTYHVGEDFADMLDGLRDVDQVLYLLGFSTGDRIGHGTVLGISVRKFYRERSFSRLVPKQDLLDDFVWLLYVCKREHISIKKELEDYVVDWICKLYEDVYANPVNSALVGTKASISKFNIVEVYADSMLLRGDHPDLYADSFIERSFPKSIDDMPGGYLKLENQYRMHMVNDTLSLRKIRNSEICYTLYRLYHYDGEVIKRGREKARFEVPIIFRDDYLQLIENVQKRLFDILQEKGIHIEMNPSSNVAIGAFDGYTDHPLFEYLERCKKDNHDFNGAIYTDDQGIFYTSLANEYNLIEAAMLENGYPPDEIKQSLGLFLKRSVEYKFS